MEDTSFNQTEFNNYLIRLIQNYQQGEINAYKRGAVSALLQVFEQMQRSMVENEAEDREESLPKGHYFDS